MPFIPVPSQIDFVFVLNFTNCANCQCCPGGNAGMQNIHTEESYNVGSDGVVSDVTKGALFCCCGVDSKPSATELALRAETVTNVHERLQTLAGGNTANDEEGMRFANFVGYLGHVNFWKLLEQQKAFKGKQVIRIEETYSNLRPYWPKIKEVFDEIKSLPPAENYQTMTELLNDQKTHDLFNNREVSVLRSIYSGCGPCSLSLRDFEYIQSKKDLRDLAATDTDPELFHLGERAAKQLYTIARAFKDAITPTESNPEITFPPAVTEWLLEGRDKWVCAYDYGVLRGSFCNLVGSVGAGCCPAAVESKSFPWSRGR